MHYATVVEYGKDGEEGVITVAPSTPRKEEPARLPTMVTLPKPARRARTMHPVEDATGEKRTTRSGVRF